MIREGYSFDDVLLVPRYSEVCSRSDVCVDPEVPLSGATIPFIASPMDTIAGSAMANAINSCGGITVIHRFCSIKEQIKMLKEVDSRRWFAVGINDGIERTKAIVNEVECAGVCIDVAHGHLLNSLLMVEKLKDFMDDEGPGLPIIAGSIATKKGFADIQKAGAEGVRVGIGSGSICSTRLMTGVGVPQLTAVMDCAEVKEEAVLISDGGIRKPADAVKAIAAGADFVMAGGIFAGTEECIDKHTYRGMASKEAQVSIGRFATAEGVSFSVPYKGHVKNIVSDYLGGLRSAMSYTGAHDIRSFQKLSKFIKISPSSITDNQTINFNNA